MNRDELVQEVERDFNILADFGRVCGLNAEFIECVMRLQLKVRGLYPHASRQPKERTYRPKTRPARAPEAFEPVEVSAKTRWG